jgi:hypothetical protein
VGILADWLASSSCQFRAKIAIAMAFWVKITTGRQEDHGQEGELKSRVKF